MKDGLGMCDMTEELHRHDAQQRIQAAGGGQLNFYGADFFSLRMVVNRSAPSMGEQLMRTQ